MSLEPIDMIPVDKGVEMIASMARLLDMREERRPRPEDAMDDDYDLDPTDVPEAAPVRAAAAAVQIAADMLLCAADYADALRPELAAELDAARSILMGLREGLRKQILAENEGRAA